MDMNEVLDKHNRAQDRRLGRMLDGDLVNNDLVNNDVMNVDGIKYFPHRIPDYSFTNDEKVTKIKNGEIDVLNATAKNLVTSIEIFQQGSERKQFSITLSPSESIEAFIEQRVTTVEEEANLLYVARDSIELSTAGRHGYMRAEKSGGEGFSVTGSLLVDEQYKIGNLSAMTAQILNCFVGLFGEIARKSSVWNLAGKLGITTIEVVMSSMGNIEIKMAYSKAVDKAIVDTKSKIVTMYRADGTKFYFDVDEPTTDMQKAVRILTILAVSSLEDTEFFANTIGTKPMIRRRPLTFGFNSPVIYAPITLDDLLKSSKRRFVAVSAANTRAGEGWVS